MRKPVVVWNCRNSLREHLDRLPYLQCLCRKSEDLLYKYYNDKQRIAQRPTPPKKNKNGKNPHRSHDASLFASFFRRSNPQRLPVVMNLWIECQKHWAKRGNLNGVTLWQLDYGVVRLPFGFTKRSEFCTCFTQHVESDRLQGRPHPRLSWYGIGQVAKWQ